MVEVSVLDEVVDAARVLRAALRVGAGRTPAKDAAVAAAWRAVDRLATAPVDVLGVSPVLCALAQACSMYVAEHGAYADFWKVTGKPLSRPRALHAHLRAVSASFRPTDPRASLRWSPGKIPPWGKSPGEVLDVLARRFGGEEVDVDEDEDEDEARVTADDVAEDPGVPRREGGGGVGCEGVCALAERLLIANVAAFGYGGVTGVGGEEAERIVAGVFRIARAFTAEVERLREENGGWAP